MSYRPTVSEHISDSCRDTPLIDIHHANLEKRQQTPEIILDYTYMNMLLDPNIIYLKCMLQAKNHV